MPHRTAQNFPKGLQTQKYLDPRRIDQKPKPLAYTPHHTLQCKVWPSIVISLFKSMALHQCFSQKKYLFFSLFDDIFYSWLVSLNCFLLFSHNLIFIICHHSQFSRLLFSIQWYIIDSSQTEISHISNWLTLWRVCGQVSSTSKKGWVSIEGKMTLGNISTYTLCTTELQIQKKWTIPRSR